jgi:hypothetical protein
MCTVSNIGDTYRDRWYPVPTTPTVPTTWPNSQTIITSPISREEFDALKREVEQMKRELIAAKAKDAAEGNPDCEMEDKIAILRRVAEAVGVDLDDVFGASDA